MARKRAAQRDEPEDDEQDKGSGDQNGVKSEGDLDLEAPSTTSKKKARGSTDAEALAAAAAAAAALQSEAAAEAAAAQPQQQPHPALQLGLLAPGMETLLDAGRIGLDLGGLLQGPGAAGPGSAAGGESDLAAAAAAAAAAAQAGTSAQAGGSEDAQAMAAAAQVTATPSLADKGWSALMLNNLLDLTRQPAAPNVLEMMAAAGLATPGGTDLARAAPGMGSVGDAAAVASNAPANSLAVDPAAVAAAMAAVAAMNTQSSSTIQTFGQAFHQYHEQTDAAALAAARESGSTLRILVQMLQVPDFMLASGVAYEVPSPFEVELPANGDVGALKRAICRLSGGMLYPGSMVLQDTGSAELLLPDHSPLSNWGMVATGHVVFLDVVASEPEHSARLNAQARKRRLDLGDVGGDLALGSADKGDKDGGNAPRQRFTIEEIEAVVEGVRKYGTSWARIKAAYPDILGRRTQVNIKDKWRNLQKGLANNWKDERSPLTDSLKERIRELTALGVGSQGPHMAAAIAAASGGGRSGSPEGQQEGGRLTWPGSDGGAGQGSLAAALQQLTSGNMLGQWGAGNAGVEEAMAAAMAAAAAAASTSIVGGAGGVGGGSGGGAADGAGVGAGDNAMAVDLTSMVNMQNIASLMQNIAAQQGLAQGAGGEGGAAGVGVYLDQMLQGGGS